MNAVLSVATIGAMPKKWPKVGVDPLAQWAKLRDQTLEALDHSNVLAKNADTFFGPMSVDAFLTYLGGDLLIHTWDLARTARVDERLDPTLCKEALAVWKTFPDAMMRSPQVFGQQ